MHQMCLTIDDYLGKQATIKCTPSGAVMSCLSQHGGGDGGAVLLLCAVSLSTLGLLDTHSKMKGIFYHSSWKLLRGAKTHICAKLTLQTRRKK